MITEYFKLFKIINVIIKIIYFVDIRITVLKHAKTANDCYHAVSLLLNGRALKKELHEIQFQISSNLILNRMKTVMQFETVRSHWKSRSPQVRKVGDLDQLLWSAEENRRRPSAGHVQVRRLVGDKAVEINLLDVSRILLQASQGKQLLIRDDKRAGVLLVKPFQAQFLNLMLDNCNRVVR